jgi:nitroimidazol reductase NimA-like FMN-containing flavoprotein (pyridoxamine 5'-phosphate oxidase superfamily)
LATDYEPTERTRVRRKPDRGRYERELVDRILDEALICHVGFVADGQPYVIPTIHARIGELLYLHGSPASRTLGALGDGAPCCVTATLVDGLVLARTARQHSLNYRSVMVLGTATEVADPDEKRLAMRAVVEHIVPGRSNEAREPSEADVRGTAILSIPLEEASAKVREGGPGDTTENRELPVWAGVLPLRTSALDPIADPESPREVAVPDYVRDWSKTTKRG